MSTISPLLIDAMRRVSALLQTGDVAAAHAQLEVLVADNPNYVEALRLLGGSKLALGDAVGAEVLLRKALALDPAWTPTLATLGELLLNNGNGSEAEALLLRAVQGSQRYPRAALVLARYYNDSQRAPQALAVAEPFCRGADVDAELATQHIAALAALGRHAEAVEGYQRLVAAAPNSASAHHALAIALDSANRPADAERVARQTLARGHKTAAVYYTHARSLIALDAFDQAESALRDCLRLEPRMIDAQSSLARLVWMRSGDIKQATATLDLALRTFANDDALWAAKAAVLQGSGDARAAYACLASQAARAHAAPALLVRAGLAALEFDAANALALAERALGIEATNTAARSLMTAALLGVGDPRAALKHCDLLLAASPDDQYLVALQTTAWRLLGDERHAQYCDYANLVRPIQLEVPAPWSDLSAFLGDVKQSLNRLHDPHGHPLLFQSLRHGTETTKDLTRDPDPAIQALFRAFDAPIRDYLTAVGHGVDPLRRRNHGNFRFNGSWSVRLRSSGYHNSHVHPRGWISSACYIDLPAGMGEGATDAGALVFGEPGIATSPRLPAEHAVRPAVGSLVLFPSYLWHGTRPFTSEQTRLTVAFDVVPDSIKSDSIKPA